MRSITSELSDSNRRLQKMAITDSLTECPNRRYAMEFVEQAWTTARLTHTPLSCMLIDVDWFKKINDIYGHERGDQTLILIADSIKKALGPKDVICRFGGDEFLVVCPGADLRLTFRLGEVFCKAVQSLGLKVEDKLCGVSIGVAQKIGEMDSFKALLEAADHALYLAKRHGRGRAEAYVGKNND
jgi:diguanylate cyclase (GGDEF)-like protein